MGKIDIDIFERIRKVAIYSKIIYIYKYIIMNNHFMILELDN